MYHKPIRSLIFAYYERSQDNLIPHKEALEFIIKEYKVDYTYWSHKIALRFPFRLMACKECGQIFRVGRHEKHLYCEDHRGLELAMKRGIKKWTQKRKKRKIRDVHIYRIAI